MTLMRAPCSCLLRGSSSDSESGCRLLKAFEGNLLDAGADLAHAWFVRSDSGVYQWRNARLSDFAHVDRARHTAKIQSGDDEIRVLSQRDLAHGFGAGQKILHGTADERCDCWSCR